jgi:hypothetical protein
MATCQVDDGQPTESKTDISVGVEAGIVGATVDKGVGHSNYIITLDRVAANEVKLATDSAHYLLTSLPM